MTSSARIKSAPAVSRRTLRRIASVLVTALFCSQQIVQAGSNPLPSGGAFTAGSGAISTAGNAVTIDQSSTRGIIDWNTFSIGQGNSVFFQNGAGATLNRVDGGAMSLILGSLGATGTIYLINPEGVVIGSSGKVVTGGDFLASTLNLSNSQFLSGGGLVFDGSSSAAIKNLGQIFSQGGNVFLISRSIDNQGLLSAGQGTVGLGAGQTILLKDASSDQRIFVQAAGAGITNTGSIAAAEAELKTVGGNIYALAGNQGGQISATGTATRDGRVWLVADGGTTTVTGAISARNADGTGGSIETSGKTVSVANARITTGSGGSWLLDPDDLTIDAPLAATIAASLNNGTDVTEETNATGTNGSGDINVNSPISWTSASSLTLSAYRNVDVNAAIANVGAGNLTLRADNSAIGSGTVNFAGAGGVNFASSTGNVSIFYHPSSFPTATDFSSNVTIGTGAFMAYMTVDSMGDLQNIQNNLSGDYALNTNLDASNTANFAPIGTDPNNVSGMFSGVFDGQGHIISNLTINDSVDANVGLFGIVTSTAQIRNLSLLNENVTGINASNVGGLAGTNYGTISASSTTGSVTGGDGAQAGGLVGLNAFFNQSVISNCYSSASVTTGQSGAAGGLVGFNDYTASISDSFATGSVHGGQYSDAGGLAGYNDGTIATSFGVGPVTTGAGGYAGGLVGLNDVDGVISSSDWNVSTNPDLPGVGSDSGSSVISGQTTSQLQSGTLPTGFNSTYWTAMAGRYPSVVWQGTLISGTVFDGAATLASAGVSGIFDGLVFDSTTTNGSGAYTLILPRGAAPSSGVLTYLTSGGVGNTFSDGSNFDIYTGSLQLINSTASTYSAILAALANTLGSNSNANLLFTLNGGNLSLGGNANLNVLNSSLPLTLDTSISTAGKITIDSSAGIIIGQNGSISTSAAGDALILASGTTVTNNSNAQPLSVTGGGRWLIYSQNPANDQLGNLAYAFKQYNDAYGSDSAVQGSGNGLLYSYAPVLTVSLTGNVSKTYDTTTSTSLSASNYSIAGLSAGDQVTLSGAASYDNKNAGVGKDVTATGLSILSANDSAVTVYGYQLASSTASGNIGTILKASVTASVAADNKTYDGTTNAAGSVNDLTGVLSGDSVSLDTSATSYRFGDKNVGSNKVVSASGTLLSGADQNNYQLTVEDGTANITPATLTASVLANNKTYDATTQATGSMTSLQGLFGSDSVQLTGAAAFQFSDKNVGNNKPVSVSGLSITGADAGNYNLVLQNGFSNITPATLTAAVSASNKTYDGTVNASGSVGALQGVLGTDAVQLIGNSAYQFADKNVGNNKTVTESGLALTGADAQNYVLAPLTGSASITPATLTYVSDSVIRVYGTNNPPLTGSVTGFVPGETLASATTGALAFTTSANATSSVAAYAVNGSGLTALNGNYVFVQAAGNSTALTVQPIPNAIVITVDNATKLSGQPDPQFSATYSGPPVPGVDIASILAGLSFKSTETSTSGAGTYQISATLGALSPNYSVVLQPGLLTIVDDSPVTIPTQAAAAPPASTPAPAATPSATSTAAVTPVNYSPAATGTAVAPNTVGSFSVNYAPTWTKALDNEATQSQSITASSFVASAPPSPSVTITSSPATNSANPVTAAPSPAGGGAPTAPAATETSDTK